jgi:hypothetical protein
MAAPAHIALRAHLADTFARTDLHSWPYRHWLLHNTLPESVAAQLTALPFPVAAVGDTKGRRETNNASRIFFSPENRARHSIVEAVVAAFQDVDTVRRLERLCATDLAGTALRIEYCQDSEGFWLEPHTDIAVKKLTMLVYLSGHPDAENWGTDIYDAERRLVGRASGAFNNGLIFVPGLDTWHGYERRPMAGLRRSLIINYVGPEWRAREELA